MIRFHCQFDPRAIRLLVFDLDGTLIDSRLDLVHSVNATLRHFERPELPDELIAAYVGDGAPTLIRRALGGRNDGGPGDGGPDVRDPGDPPIDEPMLRAALEYFLAYYRIHKLDHTVVYEGIPEVLAALASGSCGAGISARTGADKNVRPTRQMAVLSNKPVNPSRAIVEALGLGDFFVRIYGGNSFTTKKPDPLGVQTILEETGFTAAEALMIGDSSVDVLTGRSAGLWTCGVTYGFAPQTLEEVAPDVVVDRPGELGELFQ